MNSLTIGCSSKTVLLMLFTCNAAECVFCCCDRPAFLRHGGKCVLYANVSPASTLRRCYYGRCACGGKGDDVAETQDSKSMEIAHLIVTITMLVVCQINTAIILFCVFVVVSQPRVDL